MNIDKLVKQVSRVYQEMFRAGETMFEGTPGGLGSKSLTGATEHRVTQTMKAVSVDKSFARQWHRKATAA